MPRTEKQNAEIRERTKALILDASLRLFAQKGYHGTSINDIAKEAGISKGLAYNYFPSKQAIAEGIIQNMLKVGEELAKEFYKPVDPFERLDNMLEASFNYIKENEDYWKLILNFTLQPDVLDYAMKISKEFNDKLLAEIKTILKKLGIKNPAMEARLLGAMVDGVSLHYITDKTSVDLKKVKKAILDKYRPAD